MLSAFGSEWCYCRCIGEKNISLESQQVHLVRWRADLLYNNEPYLYEDGVAVAMEI